VLRNPAGLVDNGHVEMAISIAAGIIADIHSSSFEIFIWCHVHGPRELGKNAGAGPGFGLASSHATHVEKKKKKKKLCCASTHALILKLPALADNLA
jgi:hypothetical protein